MKKKIGIALGGGGARGFAHIGVLEVLVGSGIPISVITGCSMGALVGGAHVAGVDIRKLEDAAEHLGFHNVFDVGLTSVLHGGFMKGDSAMKIFRNLIGEEKQIEDCEIKFASIAVDLVEGKLHVFDKGPLTPAVRASMSIPGVYTPIIHEGKTLVDGGVLKRVPIQEARDLGADIVIAVDVLGAPWKDAVIKGPFDVVERAFTLLDSKTALHENKQADFLIMPDLGNRSIHKFKDNMAIIEKGRAAALTILPKLLKFLESAGVK
jgi:NTE family protein